MAELEKFQALYGKIDFPADILSIPFEILEYSDRLGLSASEFKFICWIFHLTNKDFNRINDSHMTANKTSFCRQRKSLKAKGYLKIKISRTYQQGKLISGGLIYDFTELKNKIEELKEEDKRIQQLEAPVMTIVDEPSLYDEEIDNSPLFPSKLLNNDDEIKEIQLQNEFLEKFKNLYEEVLKEKLDYTTRTPYKNILLNIFSNRINNNIDEVLEIVKLRFLELKKSKSLGNKPSLKLQDLVKYALLKKHNNSTQTFNNTNNKKELSIPRGIDKLNYLLKIIEEGGNLDEAYLQIANCS